ncbi:MAG: L-glutamate gamma-semialdehyde dehydrogenase, partial [Acidovorax sp.]|nr:L-glutamate gamma-semialdehyde dehydrogenase [Acidovorax sp.]
SETLTAGPIIGGKLKAGTNPQPVTNPFDTSRVLGHVSEATEADIDAAVDAAARAQIAWDRKGGAGRAGVLRAMGDALEADMDRLVALLSREAGKTLNDGVAEVREAADFCRYYAMLAERDFGGRSELKGPVGEINQLVMHGRGVFACISPWNFPLAIFMGQVAAALAAGNPVLAKPAEQTPLIAAEAVRLLWRAGVPRAAVQLLPGQGETVGARLIGDARVMGVMFTGSTEVARILQRTVAGRLDAAGRPIPLIAETGGQNAMIVDSSALVEQVVADAVSSAFDSAGQRCSALRVLCVQEEAADRVVEMLQGAMGELRVGNPAELRVDVGPVIDAEAQLGITRHIEAFQAKGHHVYQHPSHLTAAGTQGTFVPPTLIELNHIGELQREVFGPVLHLVRYARNDLDRLLDQINATGYGLTQGVHTRIDETIARVVHRAHAGNVYVNRNMVGAVVGVQPFGGEGLSGTGPKAGGPLYLLRLLSQRPAGAMAHTFAEADRASPPEDSQRQRLLRPLTVLQEWAQNEGNAALAAACQRFGADTQSGTARTLPGPTGERNVYTLAPRQHVLCLAQDERDLLVQTAAVLATGGTALWAGERAALRSRLPAAVQAQVALQDNVLESGSAALDAVLHHGDAASLHTVCQALARRAGPIVNVTSLLPGATDVPLERLLIERALSVNTAAAGGNASLMTIG